MSWPTPRAGERQGRFELKRELGRGAQACVWLASDPLLQRDVALKLLESEDGDAGEREHWLHEARAVSALSHPNVVPVFEAVGDSVGKDRGARPYLVFEFVDGPTLAQASRQRGAWPAHEAVATMLGVLDALAAAHALGLVHRDLKPSNVLLGGDGRARVMDFGIAAHVPGTGRPGTAVPGGAGAVVGTPGYISPEAARGETPIPAMDVFAAGVMLAELLSGQRLLKETDPWRAVERVQQEDLALPADVRVDDGLRGIVQRALARDALARYESARAMHDALSAWAHPQGAEAGAGDAAAEDHATLAFLLRRMRHKSDFPALSSSVLRIQRLASSDTARLAHLADEVLTDVALTAKLLRMVNSVHFTSSGSGRITTVSRAVALVGFAGIRNMALTVLLLEHMRDKDHALLLREEFLRALTVAALAGELEPREREGEEAFLGALMQNLGRLLVEYYFPEEASRIRDGIAKGSPAEPGEQAARDTAARQVLGLTLDELGCGVARAWGLPEALQEVMRRPEGAAPARAIVEPIERLRWLGQMANTLVDATRQHPAEGLAQAVELACGPFGPALNITPKAANQALRAARERAAALAKAMGLKMPRQAQEQPMPAPPRQAGTAAMPTAPAAAGANPPETASAAAVALGEGRARIEQGLSQGRMRLNEVLQLSLATLREALSCRNVVLCLRDGGTAGRLTGRIALGATPAPVFQVGPASQGDLLAVVCARAVDTLIADAATVAARMPAWWRQQVRAGSFLLLPMVVKGATVGLIYADQLTPGSLASHPAELAEARALRDTVVVALAAGLR